MGWTKYQGALALLMVSTGSINTIATKWADMSKSVGKDGGDPREFNHPFLQAVGMFLGEFTCLLAFKAMMMYYRRKQSAEPLLTLPAGITGSQDFSPLIFLAPAMCDMIGTSIMYVGLNLTYASSFQMLRGSVIVFTALLSVGFLERQLKKNEYIGIFFIIIGLVIVGVSDVLFPPEGDSKSANSLITGDLLIIMAQIITATQMVVEEKFVTKHNVPPLQAVGWEGLFGMVILSLLLIPFNFIPAGHQIFDNPNGTIEDPIDGFVQIGNCWKVALGVLGTILSISFFNFAGISVTKELSATTRMVLDSVRTLVVWLFSMAVSWQKFSYIQLIGFFILSIGMAAYNNLDYRVIVSAVRNLLVKMRILKPRDEDQKSIVSVEDPVNDSSINSTQEVKY